MASKNITEELDLSEDSCFSEDASNLSEPSGEKFVIFLTK